MSIQRARVEEILGAARDVRVAVLGDCMLDVYLTGDVARISPEAPVPVVEVEQERTAPGGAANVAAGVTALGARCELIGVVGRDETAEQLKRALAEVGVASDRLQASDDRVTTTKTRVMARHQHVVRFDRESETELPDDLARRMVDSFSEVADTVGAVIMQDYNKGVLLPSVIRRVVATAREREIPSVADPKLKHFFEYRGVHVFKPNAKELAAALGAPAAPRDAAGLTAARDQIQCEHLLLTLAGAGMILLGPEGEPRHIHAVARDVFDVSGAGDTVTAVAATCLAAGATELEAAAIANYAAGVEVSKAGVVPVRPEEILDALDDHRERQDD